MKKIVILVASIFFGATTFAQDELVVDANAEVRNISENFTAIKVSGGIDLYLSQSSTNAIAVSASDDNFKQAIKTLVENGTLRIYYEGVKGWNKSRKLKVYVSFKTLEKLEASGSSDVRVAGEINGNSLVINLSGASGFKGKVKLGTLRMDLSGASDATLSGVASTVKIESSGASDVKGYELVADICSAKASGASDINITVSKEIDASATGASDIFYKGSAIEKEVKASGASTIARSNN